MTGETLIVVAVAGDSLNTGVLFGNEDAAAVVERQRRRRTVMAVATMTLAMKTTGRHCQREDSSLVVLPEAPRGSIEVPPSGQRPGLQLPL